MTNSANPDPQRTPGLEPGGGVPPGETPPAEGNISGLSHKEPTPPQNMGKVVMLLIVILTLLVLGLIVAQFFGLISVLSVAGQGNFL